MPSFLPKTVRVRQPVPECVDLKELFETDRFSPSVTRVINHLSRVHAGYGYSNTSHSDLWQPGVINERFYLKMPTWDAFLSEIELMNAIHSHALGNIDDENIKVYLKKYLDTHIFIYKENTYEIKSGESPFTGRAVDLYLFNWLPLRFGGNCVLNAIQTWLYPRIEARNGNNAQYSISKL